MENQTRASECPRCGSSTDVRTARELFDTLNPGPGQSQGQDWNAGPGQSPGQGHDWNAGPGQSPGQGQDWNAGQGPAASPSAGQSQDTDQGQAQAPAQGQAWGSAPPQGPSQGPAWNYPGNDDYDHYNVENSDPVIRNRNRVTKARRDFDIFHPVDSIADDIGGAVTDAAVGFLGRRLKKAFEEKVMPAVQARMAQAQPQNGPQRNEQDAIAARYPDLRVCLKDQVIFLHGQYQTIPVGDLTPPLTLAQADAVVARLR